MPSSDRVRTFSRFKYAEEHASGLDRFVMFNVLDVDHEEDGEVYTYDEYVVVDLGGR